MDSYVHFDNPTAIYSGGQTVSGRVEINLTKINKIKGITIVLRGKAKTVWHENRRDHSNRKQSRTDMYYGTEDYFKEKIKVLEGFNGETIELPTGRHIYPFKYLLPLHLPPSFESHYGYIRYSVKAILERPWKFDKKIKSPFVIETPPDFTENPRIRDPATLTMEKTFGFLMFKSEPLKGILKVPHCGFICGQSIPVSLEINNFSNVAVKGIKFEFNKLKKFTATHPLPRDKVNDQTIWKSYLDCFIDCNASKKIEQQIHIPHFDILNMTHCSIINIEYELKVEIQTVGLHLNMIGNLPIFPMNSTPYLDNGTTQFNPINNDSKPMDNITISEENKPSLNVGWKGSNN